MKIMLIGCHVTVYVIEYLIYIRSLMGDLGVRSGRNGENISAYSKTLLRNELLQCRHFVPK